MRKMILSSQTLKCNAVLTCTAPSRHAGVASGQTQPGWRRRVVDMPYGIKKQSHSSRHVHGTPTASARSSQPKKKDSWNTFFSEARAISDPLRLFGDAHGTSTAPPRYLHGTSAAWSRLWAKIYQKGAAIPWRYRGGRRRAMGSRH